MAKSSYADGDADGEGDGDGEAEVVAGEAEALGVADALEVGVEAGVGLVTPGRDPVVTSIS